MNAPTGYRAPKRCTDPTCECKTAPAFVVERTHPVNGETQAEFKCPGCGLLHVVLPTRSAPSSTAKPKRGGFTSPLMLAVLAVLAVVGMLGLAIVREMPELMPLVLASGAVAAFFAILGMQSLTLRPRIGAIADIPQNIARYLLEWTGAIFIGGARGSLDFGSLATILQARANLTVTGAALGDFAEFSPETDVEAGLQLSAWVSAADTVTVCCSNNTAGTIDPAAVVYRVRVTREAKR